MTRPFYRPELKELGAAIRAHRVKLGYSAGTMAKMIGYTGKGAGRKLRLIEAAKLPMADEKKKALFNIVKNGVPPGSPEPDLETAIAHNIEKARLKREGREPGEIVLAKSPKP